MWHVGIIVWWIKPLQYWVFWGVTHFPKGFAKRFMEMQERHPCKKNFENEIMPSLYRFIWLLRESNPLDHESSCQSSRATPASNRKTSHSDTTPHSVSAFFPTGLFQHASAILIFERHCLMNLNVVSLRLNGDGILDEWAPILESLCKHGCADHWRWRVRCVPELKQSALSEAVYRP